MRWNRRGSCCVICLSWGISYYGPRESPVRIATMLVMAAVAALTSACGVFEGEHAHDSSATTTARDIDKIMVFNPCTQLSDDVLRATGVDPASKSVVTDAPTGPTSWRVCHWKPANRLYSMGVLSTSHTLDEARRNDDLTGFRDITIGTRPGLSFREKYDPENICHVAFSARQGMFEIRAAWMDGDSSDGDLCEIAMHHAADLEPHLPD